jgi:hypothetical protein
MSAVVRDYRGYEVQGSEDYPHDEKPQTCREVGHGVRLSKRSPQLTRGVEGEEMAERNLEERVAYLEKRQRESDELWREVMERFSRT